MRKSGKSFNETVNEALRVGLIVRQNARASEPLKVRARDVGLKPGFNLDKMGIDRGD
jgi:hypothetical protein